MPTDILPFLQHIQILFIIKVALLILIGLYALFTIMLATKVRSFNKIVFLPPSSGATFIQLLTAFFAIFLVALFIVTIIIV